MPQMSPIQWLMFFNMFMLILLMSSIIINYLTIHNNKSTLLKNKFFKKMIYKW